MLHFRQQIIAAGLALAALTLPAEAETYFTPGGAVVNGIVVPLANCNGSNVCQTVSSSNPLPVSIVSGGGGGGGATGSAAIATNQAAWSGTSANLIVAARTGVSGTGRIAVTIYNNGTDMVYIGGSSVTTSTGLPVYPDSSLTINTMAAIYGIASSGSPAMAALETY